MFDGERSSCYFISCAPWVWVGHVEFTTGARSCTHGGEVQVRRLLVPAQRPGWRGESCCYYHYPYCGCVVNCYYRDRSAAFGPILPWAITHVRVCSCECSVVLIRKLVMFVHDAGIFCARMECLGKITSADMQ